MPARPGWPNGDVFPNQTQDRLGNGVVITNGHGLRFIGNDPNDGSWPITGATVNLAAGASYSAPVCVGVQNGYLVFQPPPSGCPDGIYGFTLIRTPPPMGPVSRSVWQGTSGVIDQLPAFGDGPDTVTQSAGSPAVTVNSSGVVSAAVGLQPGIYAASGTLVDAASNTSPWSYSLSVCLVR